MCVVIICGPVCNHNLFTKPFFNITKKSRQKYKYLKNEKSFQHEINIFQHFYPRVDLQGTLKQEILQHENFVDVRFRSEKCKNKVSQNEVSKTQN